VSACPVAYERALALMEERVRRIIDGTAAELVWLLEHPPLYTAGVRAKASDIIDAGALPVYWSGRGGELTYHGPGQRVAYVMLDMKLRFRGDVRAFVRALEEWLIATLRYFGVKGETRPGRVGVWTVKGDGEAGEEAKIAALGIRVRRGVSFHGLALNVAPDLGHYRGIVPCGIRDRGVTSLADLGIPAAMKDVDYFLRRVFEERFGPVVAAAGPPDSPPGP
jgi:lipoyl(octanoyl) transferase